MFLIKLDISKSDHFQSSQEPDPHEIIQLQSICVNTTVSAQSKLDT